MHISIKLITVLFFSHYVFMAYASTCPIIERPLNPKNKGSNHAPIIIIPERVKARVQQIRAARESALLERFSMDTQKITHDLLLRTNSLLQAIQDKNNNLWKEHHELFYRIFEIDIPEYLKNDSIDSSMRQYYTLLQSKVTDCFPLDAALYAVNCIDPDENDCELIRRLISRDIGVTIRSGTKDLVQVISNFQKIRKEQGDEICLDDGLPCQNQLIKRLYCNSNGNRTKYFSKHICEYVAHDFLQGNIDYPADDKEYDFSIADSIIIINFFCEKYTIPNPYIQTFSDALQYVKTKQTKAFLELLEFLKKSN